MRNAGFGLSDGDRDLLTRWSRSGIGAVGGAGEDRAGLRGAGSGARTRGGGSGRDVDDGGHVARPVRAEARGRAGGRPRSGRPKAELVLTERRAGAVDAVGAAGEDRAGAGVAGEDRAGAARRAGRTSRSPPSCGSTPATVNRWRCRFVAAPAGGAGRRAAPGPAALDPARPGRGRRRGHAGADPDERHALVAGLDGRSVPGCRSPRSGGSGGKFELKPHVQDYVQAVHRPAVRGQGRRRRRALPQPAGAGGGAVRGREVPDPGPGPVPAGAADDAGHARAAHPRLRSATASPACSPRSTSPTAP